MACFNPPSSLWHEVEAQRHRGKTGRRYSQSAACKKWELYWNSTQWQRLRVLQWGWILWTWSCGDTSIHLQSPSPAVPWPSRSDPQIRRCEPWWPHRACVEIWLITWEVAPHTEVLENTQEVTQAFPRSDDAALVWTEEFLLVSCSYYRSSIHKSNCLVQIHFTNIYFYREKAQQKLLLNPYCLFF